MNDKPWYEKVGIWIGIFAGICAISGVSIFGNRSLIKSDNTSNVENENSYANEETSAPDKNEEDLSQDEKEYNEQNDLITTDLGEESENDPVKENVIEETVTPFVTSNPKSDTVIHADLANWTSDDRDIFNNNYTGSNTMKLSVYNMIYAMGGGSDDIIAEIHMPFGERFDDTWIINFVVMQDMVGNGSYANVTLLSGEEELYPTFTIESDTTDKLEYEINLNGIRDLVIRFECHAVDRGFCGGIIFSDKEE